MDRKDIFMSGFKSKIGYSFTYKDLTEFEAIIDFYEQQFKKQQEIIDLEDKYKELDKMCKLYSKSLYNAELNQYKDNWNKLKKYIGAEWYCYDNDSVECEVAGDILDKMQELQGSDSNVKK